MLLLHCADLIFTTRIRAEGAAAGATVGVARTLELLRAKLEACAGATDEAARLRLVIVDLDAPDAIEAVRLASVAPMGPRVVAFVSHVRGDLAAAAREAGADQVMARSAFVERLPAMVAEAGA